MLLTITPAQIAFLKKYFGENFHDDTFVTKHNIYLAIKKGMSFNNKDIELANFKKFETFNNFNHMPLEMRMKYIIINNIHNDKIGYIRIAIPPSLRN